MIHNFVDQDLFGKEMKEINTKMDLLKQVPGTLLEHDNLIKKLKANIKDL